MPVLDRGSRILLVTIQGEDQRTGNLVSFGVHSPMRINNAASFRMVCQRGGPGIIRSGVGRQAVSAAANA